MRIHWLFAIVATVGAGLRAGADEAQGVAFFESKIRPLLVERCYSCHSAGAKKLKGRLYVDSLAGLLKGGESGSALVPGSPEKSKMIEAVGYKNVDLQMPPKDKLSDKQIADMTEWVKMGAPWPKSGEVVNVKKEEGFDLAKRKAAHWCWTPVKAPPGITPRF